MEADERLLRVFYDVQRGLPRQGPGSTASTLRALALCESLPAAPSVLDIGCGPGAQTMVLANALPGPIIAVDTCQEYLDQLMQRAREAGVAERIETLNVDMASLDLPPESIDLIWCEAAAYAIGVPQALKAWRPLLSQRGCMGFSDLVWLHDSPPEPVVEFWRSEYPAMARVDTLRAYIDNAGYELVGDFTLPDSAWWNDYYRPLEAKLPALRQKHAGDEEALRVVEATQAEITMRRDYAAYYGYHFFVAKKR